MDICLSSRVAVVGLLENVKACFVVDLRNNASPQHNVVGKMGHIKKHIKPHAL